MQVFVGTSGYSYKEWKGSFYPEKLPQKEMLSYYATRLSVVEINNTFYRMPKSSVLEGWGSQVPEDFRFVLKASQKITHFKRLNDVESETDYLLSTASVLGEKLGPVLFQLPPNFKQNLERLEAFLDNIPPGSKAVFEFRNESWFAEETYELLKAKGIALCVGDVDDADEPEIVPTTNWAYLRLRRSEYKPAALKNWLKRLRDHDFEEAYVFFKHEDAGTGPALAEKFANLANE